MIARFRAHTVGRPVWEMFYFTKAPEFLLKTIMIACLASLIALPAMAKRDPAIKSSGIVIHLFGPTLITTSQSPAGAASAPTGNGAAAGTSPTATREDASQPEPTLHEVLREMFVTGDPAQDGKPHFARSRAASNKP